MSRRRKFRPKKLKHSTVSRRWSITRSSNVTVGTSTSDETESYGMSRSIGRSWGQSGSEGSSGGPPDEEGK